MLPLNLLMHDPMNKILLILQREYLSRVRKRSFIVMTLLGPLLMGGVIAGIAWMNKADSGVKKIAVVDQSRLFTHAFKSTSMLQFTQLDYPVEVVRRIAADSGFFGVLFIPATPNLSALEKAVVLYSESQPGLEVVNRIENTIEQVVLEIGRAHV